MPFALVHYQETEKSVLRDLLLVRQAFGEVARVYAVAAPAMPNGYRDRKGTFIRYGDSSHAAELAEEIADLAGQGSRKYLKVDLTTGQTSVDTTVREVVQKHLEFRQQSATPREERQENPPVRNYDLERQWPDRTANSAVLALTRVYNAAKTKAEGISALINGFRILKDAAPDKPFSLS